MRIFTAIALLPLAICYTPSAYADTFGSGANSFDIEFVTIGSPGNSADVDRHNLPVGAVPHAYRIGKYEISESMIDKAGSLGAFPFDTPRHDQRGPNKPVTSFFPTAAIKFVNWLNTSTGSKPAYYSECFECFTFPDPWPSSDPGYDPDNIYRNKLAHYFLPDSDEWYKAAYYDPAKGIYYDYPTGSDGVPDGIDFDGDTIFDAVFGTSSSAAPNDITNVGALSPYGTAGQGGNVYEYTFQHGSDRDFDAHGGGWYSPSFKLFAPYVIGGADLQIYHPSVGFRIASKVPEPSMVQLWAIGIMGLMWWTRRN